MNLPGICNLECIVQYALAAYPTFMRVAINTFRLSQTADLQTSSVLRSNPRQALPYSKVNFEPKAYPTVLMRSSIVLTNTYQYINKESKMQ